MVLNYAHQLNYEATFTTMATYNLSIQTTLKRREYYLYDKLITGLQYVML